MKQDFLIIICACLFNLSCSQNVQPDTAETFAKRFQKSLASPTRKLFDEGIMISKNEHRELIEFKVRMEYSDYTNTISDAEFDKMSDERHEFEWKGETRNELNDNWLDNAWNIWEDAVCLEAKIDTSAAFLKELAAKNKSKTVQIGHFTAKYSLSKLGDGYKGMAFQTLVCKINDGNWKICRYIGVEVIR